MPPEDHHTDDQIMPGATEDELRAEIRKVRDEAAQHRVRAKNADEFRDRLRAAALAQASAGVLHEPIDWDDAYDGEDGFPDAEKISTAVAELATTKPWLTRPHGDAGSGFRGNESDAVDLAQMLRDGA